MEKAALESGFDRLVGVSDVEGTACAVWQEGMWPVPGLRGIGVCVGQNRGSRKPGY